MRERRLARRQAKAELLLRPLLLQALTPVAEAMARLEQAHQQQHLQVLRTLAPLLEQQPETRELLLEVLQATQPRPETELAQRLGLPQRLILPHDSAS
jgi:hypothetical protein